MLVTDATLPGNPITFANAAFISLSGYTMDELLGQDPHFMIREQTDPEAIQRYTTAIAKGRDETLEILQYRKDGTPIRAMLIATPLDDGQRHGPKSLSLEIMLQVFVRAESWHPAARQCEHRSTQGKMA